MFVGHPPSLQRLWKLPADLVHTSLDELRSRQEVKLLSLQELLRLLKRRQRALDQVNRSQSQSQSRSQSQSQSQSQSRSGSIGFGFGAPTLIFPRASPPP